MTTMMDTMMMSELNNDVSEPPKATANTPNSSTPPTKPASQEGLSKVNHKKKWDSTWVRPMGITAGIVGIGTLFAVVKMSLPDAEVQSVDGGVVDSIRVNPSNDGRNELNEAQTKYLSEQDIANAEKDAREGVTNSLILAHPETSTEGVNYSTAERTDLGAVVDQRVSTAPKTIAQLRQENEESRNSLYDEAIDNEGRIYFIRRKDNLEIMPVDSVPNSPRATASSNTRNTQQTSTQYAGQGTTANPNATYAYSNNDYNAGGGNQGGNDGSAGGGQGGNAGQATDGQTNQNEQQQQPQPDPEIEAKRSALKSDFEDYQAQNSQLEQQYQQHQQFLQQQYQQRQQYRSEQANTALNNAINQVQTVAGTRNSYTPLSYTNPNANATGGNNQSQSSNGQNGTPSFTPADFGLGDSSNNSSFQGVGSNNNQTPAPSNTNNYTGNLGFGSSNYGTASQPTGEILDQRLPVNVVRAGTKWQAVITNSVNTDDGLQVVGQLVNGKFAGSTVYGIVALSGRNIGVRFSTIAPPNPRKPLIPIDSYATTLLQNKTAVSNDVSYHYIQNYGIKGLTSILRGVGEAYEGAGEKTIVTENGKVITTKDSEPSSKVIRGNVLKELGVDLTNDIARLGNRAPTYRIPIGTVVNVVLASDLDVNATTSSVAGSGINTGIGGNRNTN